VFHAAGSSVRFGLLDGAWVDITALHLSSFTRVKFIVYCYIFYRFIVKCLCPLFVGGAIQILLIDWLIDHFSFFPFHYFVVLNSVFVNEIVIFSFLAIFVLADKNHTVWQQRDNKLTCYLSPMSSHPQRPSPARSHPQLMQTTQVHSVTCDLETCSCVVGCPLECRPPDSDQQAFSTPTRNHTFNINKVKMTAHMSL